MSRAIKPKISFLPLPPLLPMLTIALRKSVIPIYFLFATYEPATLIVLI